MEIKKSIKLLKVKRACEKAKQSVVDLCGDIKGINISLDFENKKHTIEILTK